MMIMEYQGLTTSSPLDKTASTSADGSTAISTGTTATTTQASELLVAAFGFSGVGTIFTPGSSFTYAGLLMGSNMMFGSQTRIVSSTGTYTGTATADSAQDYSGAIATFKANTATGRIKHKVNHY